MAKIEGRNPVYEALKGNRRIDEIFIQEGITGGKIDQIISEAEKQGIRIVRAPKRKIDQMSNTASHQGVIAHGAEKELVSPIDIVNYAEEKGELPFIIILDQIQDPHNFGAIIRTACAAGAHGVIYPKKRSAGITSVVLKSSAGAVEHIKLSEVANINFTIDVLKERGLWIIGADMEGEFYYFEQDLKIPLALVIGNEGEWIRRLVKEKCDFLINIPMPGKISSLNASTAAAIIIYEVFRQRFYS